VLKGALGRGLKTKLNRKGAKNAKRVFCWLVLIQALRAGRGGILFADFGLLIPHRGVGPYGPEAELRYKRVLVCNGGRCFIFPLSLNRQDAKNAKSRLRRDWFVLILEDGFRIRILKPWWAKMRLMTKQIPYVTS